MTIVCGIFTAVSKDIGDEQARRALRTLQARGPDGEGLWRSPRGDALLGHRRLSIIDIPGGNQPLVNETGEIAAVVNGEFYGFDEIIDELTARGHRFRTRCDSEILIHLYEDYGLDAVDHLRGEFAFALWDDRQARLVAGRDRFGVKPLFYAEGDEGLWMASEAKALFAAGVAARWDEEAFYQHLFLMHAAGRSLFAGVRQVPAGHLLVFENGRARTIRYWDLDYPIRGDAATASPDALIDEFREQLHDAVRVRLRADTPVGYFLSGGLDSSMVIGLASRYWEDGGRAFTVRFDHPAYDEGEVARGTATRIGAAFTPIVVSDAMLADSYPEAIARAETTGNLHAAARYLQSRAAHEAGFKVALTGDGADEVLGGYVHYGHDVTCTSAEELPAALRPMQARLGHVPCWVRRLASERSIVPLLLARDYRERMRSYHPYLDCLDDLDCDGQLADRQPLHQSLYLWNKTMLPNYVLGAERLEMAFAVETRPPFLDHRLFESIRRMPTSLLVRGQSGKHALRKVAYGVVSDTVLGQTKHPFAAPSGLASAGSPLFTHVDEMFRGRGLMELTLFDRASVLALWTEYPEMPAARRAALEPVLLMVFCACVLHQRYVRA